MFTPQEIRDTEFERVSRGYNCDDVDGFLSQIAEQIEGLIAEKDAAEKRAREAEEKYDSMREDSDALRAVLVTAEKMKEQMLSEARELSDRTITEATQRAQQLVSDAQLQSDTIVGEIAAKSAAEEATLKTLKKQVSDFKNTVLNLYKTHLETLSELPEDDSAEVESDYSAEEAHAAVSAAADEAPAEAAPMEESFGAPGLELPPVPQPESAGGDFSFPDFGEAKPAEAAEKPAEGEAPAAAFSFSAPESDKNRFGKLDFGDSFTFGAD
ncbi:MAG: DivIVA domain-containing protein [Oscillospiraceae bacterium]|nr:DivIVA domain-containing protein [Oscillospiraceae bacterium]